jgi:predicted nicotinamide N-methyase
VNLALERAALAADLNQRFKIDRTTVDLRGWKVVLERPQNADDLISEADYVRDERLPYWADLWAASTDLARYLLEDGPSLVGDIGRRRGDGKTPRAIELGCGLGLPTIAAMKVGFDVLATDYYEDSVRFAAHNAYAALGRAPQGRMVDWNYVPDDLGTFDLVLAADVLYEPRYAVMLADVVARTLAPRGIFLLGDQGRIAMPAFLDEAAKRGLRMHKLRSVAPPPGVTAPTVSIYEGTRSS